MCGKIIDFDFIDDLNILNIQYKLINELDFEVAVLSHQLPITKSEVLNKISNKIDEIN